MRPEFHSTGKDRRLPAPRIFKMRVFAPDQVIAKSRFWYYLRRLNKVKKSHGEILACSEVSYWIKKYSYIQETQIELKPME